MTSKLKIEKNVEIPDIRSRSEKHFPWLDMAAGDSFTVEGKSAVSSARGSFRRYQWMLLIPDKYVVIQRRVDGTKDTYRLWLDCKKED
jgi:hypothetical protein